MIHVTVSIVCVFFFGEDVNTGVDPLTHTHTLINKGFVFSPPSKTVPVRRPSQYCVDNQQGIRLSDGGAG